ncbi:protein Mpv17 [Tribolium madens]|uniref:protein Mpv17 n=1 Tax=Tribolium madens TaxID=41895 RepID=UPI001CF72762|nr:protein Mpv17 [Tribolium madens]
MRWLFKVYETFLIRHPKMTQAVQTGVLMGAGDVISQVFIEEQPVKKLNYKRTLQFVSVGAFYVGPALTIWYGVLDKYVGKSGKRVALTKVALDQICFAPVCLLGFMVTVGALQGKTVQEVKRAIRETYPDILLANYKLWPAAQTINFYFVPLQYQVLYAQVVALFWNVYLCFKTKPEK